MKCSDKCPHYKPNDAVKQLDDGVGWFCTHPHSQCEDVVCLLRMMLWELESIREGIEE